MDISVSDIVLYRLTQPNVDAINKRRNDALKHRNKTWSEELLSPSIDNGYQSHVGNSVLVGDVYPLLVVRVWAENRINGQVWLDGNDTLWVTSVPEVLVENPSSIPNGFWYYPPTKG